MAERYDVLEYFIAAPAGAPDEVLGSIAALIATKSCSVKKCDVSSTCNPYANIERYRRRARLGECYNCFNEVSISRVFGNVLGEDQQEKPRDPEIVDVDPVSPGSFMRQEAITAMDAFWEVVDAAAHPDNVFDATARQRIADAIRENYGDMLPQ